MNDSHMASIAQLKEFLQASKIIEFKAVSREEKYKWIESTLNRFGYFSLRKKDKGIVKRYICQMTGLSKGRVKKLVGRKRKSGKVCVLSTKRHKFSCVYTPKDIGLLSDTDKFHGRLSGNAAREIFRREFEVFGDKDYERLSRISVSHIYNLRGRKQYASKFKTFVKTKKANVPIGQRRKPQPFGVPGYIRVDSVHQGDMDKEKGMYHINLVDEVTQWEIVGSVEGISEKFLVPLLENLISQFPFCIINFHSDNGSEYINKVVAKLLNKLNIQQTKSRSRHCNDNALCESKNGSVIRKHMGYIHIPKRYAKGINDFYKSYFNVYLNYHRPCGFASVFTDDKGKQKKKYDTYMCPYEKLLSLKNPEQYLKEGITAQTIKDKAMEKSDNKFAKLMQEEKDKLFTDKKQQ